MSSSSGRFHAEVDDFVTAQSALKLMLDRIFDKLDVNKQGYLEETPDPAQVRHGMAGCYCSLT